MLPNGLNDFFVATATASASFIGLLFVAISLIQERLKDRTPSLERVLAESAYTAFINVFFISIVGLIPGTSMSYVIASMAIIGLSITVRYLRSINRSKTAKSREYGFLSLSFAVYIVEALYAAHSLIHPNRLLSEYSIMTLVLFLFAIGLTRAWELTGIRTDEHR